LPRISIFRWAGLLWPCPPGQGLVYPDSYFDPIRQRLIEPCRKFSPLWSGGAIAYHRSRENQASGDQSGRIAAPIILHREQTSEAKRQARALERRGSPM